MKKYIFFIALLFAGSLFGQQIGPWGQSWSSSFDSTWVKILADHVGERTSAHGTVFDNDVTFTQNVILEQNASELFYVTSDGDTIKFNPRKDLHVMRWRKDGTVYFSVDSLGNLTSAANIKGATYGSDGSVSDAELLYINTLSSNAQTQLGTMLLKTLLDDSLNNSHTITNQWGFTGGLRAGDDFYPTVNGGADLGRTSFKWDSLHASGAIDMRSAVTTASILKPTSFGIYGYGSTDTMLVISNDKNAIKDSSFVVTSAGNVGIGTTSPQHQVSMVGATPTLNIVDSDVNKLRTSAAQASDSASWKIDASNATGPVVTWSAVDGDQYTQSINTSDQAVFAGAAGYNYDAPIILSNGVTAGAAAFCTNAVKDTVAIASALSTDIYTFDWTSDPGSPGAHWYTAYAGGVYFYTDAATTGNPSYTWTRWGKN